MPSFSSSLHKTLLANHPGEQDMYEFMVKVLHYSNKVSDVYATVRDCRFYARNRTHRKPQRPVKQCPPEDSLKYTCMDILGQLLSIKQNSRFLFLMTRWYTNLTKSRPTLKPYATTVAFILIGQFVADYGVLCKEPTDNVPQFLSKLLLAVCSTFKGNIITTPSTTGKLATKETFQLHFYLSTTSLRVRGLNELGHEPCYSYRTPTA